MKNNKINTGLSFGLTSGVITTLGLMIGLNSVTGSKLAMLGGVITIAFADALSDALGIHISKETETSNQKAVWNATFWTFGSKLIVALTFVIPLLIFNTSLAIITSIAWGIFLLVILNIKIAKIKKIKPYNLILEHLLIAFIVIILSHNVGKIVNILFN